MSDGTPIIYEPVGDHNQIANLIAKKFVARTDAKARQYQDGSYAPYNEPWTRQDFLDHLSGKRTFGHYMLNKENETKMIVFDIDIDKIGLTPSVKDEHGVFGNFIEVPLRNHWRSSNTAHEEIAIMQQYYRIQLRMLANKIMRAAADTLQCPVTMAYSGSKGVHVYVFTGLIPADMARAGQSVVLDSLGCFERSKGKNFFKHAQVTLDGKVSPELSFSGLEIEVYPKQETIAEGGYGNLVRLPLGVNRHNPSHPTFFMECRNNYGEEAFSRREAIDALTAPDPWS